MLVLLAALVAPYFIDWTAYRADFEREASNILGRKVSVKGAASARLLPFPSVTFDDVEVEDDDGSSLMKIGRFRMDAELAPYLSGEILIYSMTLDQPTIRLPLRSNGTVQWVAGDPKIPSGARVVLQNVAVNDGTVIVEDEGHGRTETLKSLNASLSAGSLAGPVDGSGSFVVDGKAVNFNLSTGIPLDDGAMPLRVTASNADIDGEIVLDGKATATGAVPGFTGSLSLVRPMPRQADASGALPAPFEAPPAAGGGGPDAEEPAVPPIRATGAITLSADEAKVSDLRVAAGGGPQPYILTGTGTLDYGDAPRFSLKLEGEQVNVDAIGVPAPEAGGTSAGEAGQGAAETTAGPGTQQGEAPSQSLSRRVEAMRAVLAKVPRPAIDGSVEVSLPVVTAGDTTIRDVAFVAEPRAEGWKLDSFAAEVPGRTRIEATGDVGVDEGFSFVGDLLVASKQPSGFSDWLTGNVDPAVRSLSRAGFAARATLTPTRQVFEGLEIDVGGDTITGRVARQEDDGKTRLTARLSGGNVDLDAVLSLSRLFTGRDRSLADADRFDLSLKAGPVTFADAKADSVDADLSLDGDSLKVDHLVVDGLAGAKLTSSGSLTDLAGGDAKGKLDVALESSEPQRFFGFLERVKPGIPLIEVLARRAATLAPLKLSGEVEAIEGAPGKKPTLLLRLDGTADGTRIDLESAVENGIYAAVDSGRFGLDLRLENDRPTILLGQLGVAAVDAAPPAPLELELSVSAGETGPAVTSATLRAPGTEVSLDGNLDVTPGGIDGADLSFYLNSEDLSPWLRTFAVDLGQSFDDVPVEANAGIVYDEGALRIAKLNGQIVGVTVSGDLDRPQDKPVAGKLAFSELSLPWLANLVYGRSPIAPAGGVAWSSQAFGASLLPPLDAAVAISADRLDLGGGLALSKAAGDLELSPTSAALKTITAKLGDADATGSLVLRNAGGLAGFSLAAEADAVDLTRFFPALAGGDGPARLDGAIRLDSSGQSYQALISALSGAGDVTVVGAKLPGIPETVLKPLLAAADAQDFKPQAETAQAFRRLSEGQAFAVPKASAEFSVTGGTLRFAPLEIPGDGSRLTLDASLDLADLALEGGLTLAIAPGIDRVEGAEPTVGYALSGSLADPKLALDAAPLANYLSVRALEREQARVEAMQESLEEKLRLRREGRFYRWRQTVAENAVKEEEARRKAAEEEARAREEEAARRKAAEEQAARDAAAKPAANAADASPRREAPAKPDQAAGADRSSRNVPPALIFDRPLPETSNKKSTFESLPGVTNPLDF
ncbi:AsmA family protein [Jiella sp. MQZ13P-4]|uniref:AsmA family protein n=1 Tax=Jiella sonneratiae TaxID=2816856 RepID=A0ABS3J073_9HYPH|nr:AsmA family protein [Jiella sonneratiae]